MVSGKRGCRLLKKGTQTPEFYTCRVQELRGEFCKKSASFSESQMEIDAIGNDWKLSESFGIHSGISFRAHTTRRSLADSARGAAHASAGTGLQPPRS
jgi:hypothetical protein